MSVNGDFYQFQSGELRSVEVAMADNLTAADSFLVSSGQVRALDRHFNRFAKSVLDEKSRRQLPGYFAEVLRLLPDSEDWFPRLEYRSAQPEGLRLFLRLRPAPERTRVVSLWTCDESDPRENPLVKGPDLSVCQRLRRAANLRGADEAVLLDERGFISDGALSSIVWWRGETLYGPDDSTPWLPSVTRDLVFEMARQAGYETAEERAKPADLAGCEVWSLSALQGIRGVVHWGEIPVAQLRLHAPFAKRLSLLSEPLPDPEVIVAKFS